MNDPQPVQAGAELLEATRTLPCPHCRGRSFTAFDRDLPGGGYAKTLDRVRCLDCKTELAADDASATLTDELTRLREKVGRMWLIWVSEGEYSDRNEWPEALMHEQVEAEAMVLRLEHLWRTAVKKYQAREEELDAANDWQGDAIWEQEPEAQEYERLTGHRGSLSGCYAEDRSFTCCEVPVWTARQALADQPS